MKKLRCESQADIFGKRDSHQWLVYMMVKWRLPCLENVINTLVWYNNTHISFAINYIALFLQSHPMWVARVPAMSPVNFGNMSISRTPCGWRECPLNRKRPSNATARSHPMWVARVPACTRPVSSRYSRVAPHVGGASARANACIAARVSSIVAPHVGGASARRQLLFCRHKKRLVAPHVGGASARRSVK